jgi:uncharacterized protein YbjT (DUF2867 family)
MSQTPESFRIRRAIVAGGSGLVGRELLRLLEGDSHFEEILLLTHREIPDLDFPKLKKMQVDYEDLFSTAEAISGEVLFCCLGTTRKKAKTPAEFQKVDLDYVRKLARLCVYRGIPKLSVLSAEGASTQSPFLYFKTKGEMEREVLELPIPQIDILRPSLLVGNRREFRLGETILAKAIPILRCFGAKFEACPASTLAQFMLNRAKEDRFRKEVFRSNEITSG